MSAAWGGTTTVRKAIISRIRLSTITTAIWSGSFAEIFDARSTLPAVLPPT